MLSDEERGQFEAWTRRRTSALALAQRSRIVLAAAGGLKSTEIAEQVGVSRNTAAIWRERFAAHRLDGLTDEPRPGRPRISDEQVDAVFTTTLGARRRTPRTAPPGQLQVLQGPAVDKLHDVVGLYLNPPERAVVLCVDEKSQIQALDRSAPILPMLPGVPERATRDYRRAGTSSLYAALDLTTGKRVRRRG